MKAIQLTKRNLRLLAMQLTSQSGADARGYSRKELRQLDALDDAIDVLIAGYSKRIDDASKEANSRLREYARENGNNAPAVTLMNAIISGDLAEEVAAIDAAEGSEQVSLQLLNTMKGFGADTYDIDDPADAVSRFESLVKGDAGKAKVKKGLEGLQQIGAEEGGVK